ncbi:MAG: glycosyltransferase [Verrucomicrobia bacterium]|nr:glycosyltransferase [Verrucomicrobiota bacterium]
MTSELPQSNEQPLVSAIIPSWNRRADLVRCLQSLSRQDYSNIEVVVVDDASEDDTTDTLRRDFPSVQILEDTVRCGHFFRRNQGIVASHGEYLLHLDSDVDFQDDGLVRRMVSRCEADPGIGEIGGEIPVHADVTDRAIGLVMTRGGYTRQVSVSVADGEARECDVLPTLNCMTRREAVEKIGGFDPYYEFGMGDVDFGLAIKRAGYRNILDGACAVYHRASPGGRRPDVTFRYCVGRLRLMLKHHGLAKFLLQAGWDMLQVLWILLTWPFVRLGGGELSDLKRDGARFIPRAYAWHFARLRQTLGARGRNFLSPAEMQAFHKSKGGGVT